MIASCLGAELSRAPELMQAQCRSDTRLMLSRLAGQLREDCRLLEELRVMDYSLLLGIHFRSPDYGSTPQATDKVSIRSAQQSLPIQQYWVAAAR